LNRKVRKTDRKIQSIAKAESKRQTKKDMVSKGLTARNERSAGLEFRISASSGAGLPALLDALRAEAEHFLAGAESALITRERHRRALKGTLAALRRALSDKVAKHEDLLAEELRTAAQALGRLTGRVDVEDVLDVIFRDFCIGK